MKILLLARASLHTQPGGDTVQVTETAHALKELGLDVTIALKGDDFPLARFDIIHFFNLGRPADILPYLPNIFVPIVVSTIYVEYGNGRFKHFKEYAKTIARWVNKSDVYPGWLYISVVNRITPSIWMALIMR